MERTVDQYEADQLASTAGIIFGVDLQRNSLRRHSYPVEADYSSDSSDDEADGDTRSNGKRALSLQNSPLTAHDGIRLGSKIAQEAAKSFWNMDMLKQSLQKIVQYAAIESSSLGSSIETINTDDTRSPSPAPAEDTPEEWTCISPIAPHLINLPFSLTPRSAPVSPTNSPPLSIQRSHSACVERKESPAKKQAVLSRKISPWYSPRTQRKVQFEVDSLSSSSGSQLTVKGEKITLISRNNVCDDGYHEK